MKTGKISYDRREINKNRTKTWNYKMFSNAQTQAKKTNIYEGRWSIRNYIIAYTQERGKEERCVYKKN